MTVLQTGQMLFVYSRKTSSRSTFCRSGVSVMAEPSCARRAANRCERTSHIRRWEGLRMNSGGGGLPDPVGDLVAPCPVAGVGGDGAGPVLGAAAPQPHEPADAEDADDGADPRVDPHSEDLVGGVDAHALEEEPAERVRREVEGEHLALAEAEPTLDPEDDAEQEEAIERLVQERRVEGRVVQVTGRALRGRDLEAPREIGGAAEELLVEVVAPAADRLGGEQPGGDAVEERERLDVLDAGHDHDRDCAAGQHAPDAEAAPPDLECAEPVVGEQLVVA